MPNITKIKEVANKLCLMNIGSGKIDLTKYSDIELNFLELILLKEQEIRDENKLKTIKEKSRLPKERDFKSYDIKYQPGVSKWHLEKLASTSWIEQNENVLIVGDAGTGKTHLAIATGYNAIRKGLKVFYITHDELLFHLHSTKEIAKCKKRLEYMKSCDLVIIDEFGYIPLTHEQAIETYNVLDKLNRTTSLLVVTNRIFQDWKNIFYDEMLASTLLDRIIEKCLVINMRGYSYRLQSHKENYNDNNY